VSELQVVKEVGGNIWLQAKFGDLPKFASRFEAELVADIERLLEFISAAGSHLHVGDYGQAARVLEQALGLTVSSQTHSVAGHAVALDARG